MPDIERCPKHGICPTCGAGAADPCPRTNERISYGDTVIAQSAYEVRPWERGTFGVMEVRTRGFAADDTWLTESEAQRRADEYNARAQRPISGVTES